MKETNYRIAVRELLKRGLTKTQIVKELGCDPSYGYKLVCQESARSGFVPPTPDRIDKLEERIRQLEKLIATLVSMKRFGGSGITQSQPETPEARLQRLISDSEHRGQRLEEGR